MLAFHEVGLGSVDLIAADFEQEGRVVGLGSAPVRVDIMTPINGVS
jgi:hypothetical protein